MIRPSRRVLVFPQGMGLSVVSRTTTAAAAGYVIEDRFTEASPTALTSHTPDVAPGGSSWVISTGTWTVSAPGYANRLKPAEEQIAFIDSGISDVAISVDMYTDVGIFNGGGIIFRYVDSSNYWFIVVTVNADSIILYERTGGNNFNRDSASVTIDSGTTYALAVTANGTSISATVDGGNEVSYTSSQHQSATIVGIRGASNRAIWDNFLVSAA